MGKKWSFFAAKMVLAGMILVTLGCTEGNQKADKDPRRAAFEQMVGKNIADVMVQTIDGQDQPLNDPILLNGKPVIVHTWATWCPTCLHEMPTLDALGKQGRYTVLAIALDTDTTTVKEFLKKQNWGSGMTVLFDPLGKEVVAKLNMNMMPSTLITDPSLTVVMAEAGGRDWMHPEMVAKLLGSLRPTEK